MVDPVREVNFEEWAPVWKVFSGAHASDQMLCVEKTHSIIERVDARDENMLVTLEKQHTMHEEWMGARKQSSRDRPDPHGLEGHSKES